MKLNHIFKVNLLLVVAMFGLSIGTWWHLPEATQIATHFDLNGIPTGYMGKTGGLLLLPGMALLFVLTMPILPKIEPYKNNIDRSAKAYNVFSLALVIFLGVVHGAIVLTALGWAIDIPTTVVLSLGIFLIVFGNYLSKIRRNHSFGVRTPWTLSSDLAWHKTHRWGSWLTVLHGVGLLITAWRSHTILPAIVLISYTIVNIAILPICSYFWWKSDPQRLVPLRGSNE